MTRPWTHADTALLTRLYATTATRELEKRLERSANSIWRRARNLGLRKDPHYLAAAQRSGPKKGAKTRLAGAWTLLDHPKRPSPELAAGIKDMRARLQAKERL